MSADQLKNDLREQINSTKDVFTKCRTINAAYKLKHQEMKRIYEAYQQLQSVVANLMSQLREVERHGGNTLNTVDRLNGQIRDLEKKLRDAHKADGTSGDCSKIIEMVQSEIEGLKTNTEAASRSTIEQEELIAKQKEQYQWLSKVSVAAKLGALTNVVKEQYKPGQINIQPESGGISPDEWRAKPSYKVNISVTGIDPDVNTYTGLLGTS